MLPDYRVRQRDYLLQITRALTEELELDNVLRSIVRLAAELLAGRSSLIALREAEGWHLASSYGIDSTFLRGVERMLSDVPDHVDSQGYELAEVERRLHRVTQTASMGLLSGVGLPLVVREEIIGVIFVFRSYEGSFTTQDRDLLQAFASQAAIAVHNARLYTEVIEQQQHLDSVVDSSADGIFILDQKFRITRFNRACQRLTGFQENEVLDRRHEDVFRWKLRASGETLEEAIEAGWPESKDAALYLEGDLLKRDGGVVSIGLTYAPILSSENKLSSIVVNMRDMTRIREAEELKSTFISVISHELRTPVALIKGYAATLRREDATWDPQVVRDSLEVIEEETDRLSHLIDDLLDASRLQAGVLSLQVSEVNLGVLVKKIVGRLSFQNKDYKFETKLPEDLPGAAADEDRIAQVISNLLSNSIKFATAGGPIRAVGSFDDNFVTICIEDNGPGIERSEIPRVFDRFYRSPAIADETHGAGLGLFLSRAIVNAHHGKIWIDEAFSEGTRICFSVPRIDTITKSKVS